MSGRLLQIGDEFLHQRRGRAVGRKQQQGAEIKRGLKVPQAEAPTQIGFGRARIDKAYAQTRRIYTDGRPLPTGVNPTNTGWSTGR